MEVQIRSSAHLAGLPSVQRSDMSSNLVNSGNFDKSPLERIEFNRIFPSERALPDFVVADTKPVEFSGLRKPWLEPSYEEIRENYLRSVTAGEVDPVVILSGKSGSGKSHLLNILESLGVAQAERLLTRPLRADDPVSDHEWKAEVSSLDQLSFGYAKYGTHYGYESSLAQRMLAHKQGLALIAGDLGKISPINEAVDSLLPLVPTINIRVEVPQEIAQLRLMHKRKEAFSGESSQRALINKLIDQWEDPQLKELKSFHDLHSVINLTPEESDENTFMLSPERKAQALDSELFKNLLSDFILKAKRRSAIFAQHLLAERRLLGNQPDMPPDLVKVLDKKLLKQTERVGLKPAIKGGLAVATYFDSAWNSSNPFFAHEEREMFFNVHRPKMKPPRPVSPDIDWTFPDDPEQARQYQRIVSELSGRDLEFQTAIDKPIFHSTKIQGVTHKGNGKQTNNPIELDAIQVSRVQPENTGFCFEFKYDQHLMFRSRTLKVNSGRSAYLVPPEVLIAEKLLAGRGADLGKLDLYDAAGLMVTQPFNINTLQHIIESQEYNSLFDPEIVGLQSAGEGIDSYKEKLEGLGVKDALLRTIVAERTFASDLSSGQVSNESLITLPFKWEADHLKRVAMIDRMIASLDKILETKKEGLSLLPNQVSIEDVFGGHSIERSVQVLKQYLYYYAKYQVGRTDVFVNREAAFSAAH